MNKKYRWFVDIYTYINVYRTESSESERKLAVQTKSATHHLHHVDKHFQSWTYRLESCQAGFSKDRRIATRNLGGSLDATSRHFLAIGTNHVICMYRSKRRGSGNERRNTSVFARSWLVQARSFYHRAMTGGLACLQIDRVGETGFGTRYRFEREFEFFS